MKKRLSIAMATVIACAAVSVTVPPVELKAADENAKGRKATNAERSRALREAMAALEAARKRNADGSGVESLRRAASGEEAERLRARASGALQRQFVPGGGAELAERAAQEQVLSDAKANATPEATALIRASAATPPRAPRPAPDLVAQNAPPPPRPGGSRGNPTPVDPADVTVPPRVIRDTKTKPEPKEKVVITAEDAAFFDANNRIAIFKGNVEVDHPTFDLSCDTLEVFFKEKKDGETKDEGGGDGGGGRSEPEAAAGEIDKVVATGKQVVIQKLSAKNQLQIGKCRKAVFHGASGQVEMLIWPQVQQGKYLIISKEEGTRMIFTQNGEMQTFGETESTFVKDDGSNDKKDPPPGSRPPELNQR